MGLIKEIRDQSKALPQQVRDLEKFAVVISSVLLLIAVLLFWFGRSPGRTLWFTGAAILIIVAALFAPILLRPLHKAWMILSFFLGGVMSRLILSLLFYLILTPVGLLLRLFGKDLLHLRRNPRAQSYWLERTVAAKTPEQYKRAF
jgi:hypothetical protein